MTRPVLTVAGSRHPFEIGAFASVFLAGLGGFIPGATSAVVNQALPSWFVHAYYGNMTVWGLIALLALCIRVQDTRMRIERIACWGIGYSAAGFVITAFYVSGFKAWTAACLALGTSIGATARIVQISIERRRIRRAAADPRPADPAPLGEPEEADE